MNIGSFRAKIVAPLRFKGLAAKGLGTSPSSGVAQQQAAAEVSAPVFPNFHVEVDENAIGWTPQVREKSETKRERERERER